MGEKRAYKARKSGGGRKKLKPEYDAGKNMKEQMDAEINKLLRRIHLLEDLLQRNDIPQLFKEKQTLARVERG